MWLLCCSTGKEISTKSNCYILLVSKVPSSNLQRSKLSQIEIAEFICDFNTDQSHQRSHHTFNMKIQHLVTFCNGRLNPQTSLLKSFVTIPNIIHVSQNQEIFCILLTMLVLSVPWECPFSASRRLKSWNRLSYYNYRR